MKVAKCVLALALGVVALLAPNTARADDVTVTADLTFDTCAAASGCQETFDISYEWDNTTNTLASAGAVITATGDLGSNFFANGGTTDPFLVLLSPANIVVYTATDPLSDSLFLTLSETGSALAPGSYTETGGIDASGQFLTKLTCGTGDGPICASSNITPSMADVTVSPVATPEPSSLLVLDTGLLGLIGMGLRRKRLS